MKNIKVQIKALSSQAAQLSQEATAAFRQRNFCSMKAVDGASGSSFCEIVNGCSKNIKRKLGQSDVIVL